MPTVSAALLAVGHSRVTARVLPSVYHNGQQHVVAEQNEDFEVKVSVVNPSPGSTYLVRVSVDSRCLRNRSEFFPLASSDLRAVLQWVDMTVVLCRSPCS